MSFTNLTRRALTVKARKDAEETCLKELRGRPVVLAVHTPPPAAEYLRRPFNPFDPAFAPPPPKLFLAAGPRSKPKEIDSLSAVKGNNALLVMSNVKEGWAVTSRGPQEAFSDMESGVRRGCGVWCLSYGAWLLQHCQPVGVPPHAPSDPDLMLRACHDQLAAASVELSLRSTLARMDALLALSDMERHGLNIAAALVPGARAASEAHLREKEKALRCHLPPAWGAAAVRWQAPKEVRDVLLGRDLPPQPPTPTLASLRLHLATSAGIVLSFTQPSVLKRLLRGKNALEAFAETDSPLRPRVKQILTGKPATAAEAKSALTAIHEACGGTPTVVLVEAVDGTGELLWTVIAPEGTTAGRSSDMTAAMVKKLRAAVAAESTLLLCRYSPSETDGVQRLSPKCNLARVAPVLQVLSAIEAAGKKTVRPSSPKRGTSAPITATDAFVPSPLFKQLTDGSAELQRNLKAVGVGKKELFAYACLVAASGAGIQLQSNVWATLGSRLPGVLKAEQHGALIDELRNTEAPPKTEVWEKAAPELADALKEYRSAAKEVRAIFDAEGTLGLLHPDGRIRADFLPWGAATGRLSCRTPNAMNLPQAEFVRRLFVPRFPGGSMIEADYSQLEVVTLSILSGDAAMQRDIRSRIDFHCKRATFINPKLSYDEVVRRYKAHDPEVMALRKQAKTFSFQRQYGAGPAAIAESSGLAIDEARRLIKQEEQEYPANEALFHATMQGLNAPSNRHAGGRVTQLPSGQRLVVPNALNGPSPTAARNFPVQGLAAQIVQIMLGRLYRRLLAHSFFDGNAVLVNTVHDCVWLEVADAVREDAATLVRDTLESAPAVIEDLWPGLDCDVPFPVTVEAGPTLADLQALRLP
jgi:hypothetical protein